MSRHPRPGLTVTAFVVAALLTACGGTASTSSGSKTGGDSAAVDTIRTAFYNDMQVPDPDVFYEVEGNQVVMSTYEGLLRYKLGGTTEIEPLLAERYEKSADGLTYTFTLRKGVTFVDGTDFDSAAAKFSFERRLKVNNAPAYMLADLDTMETPDPSTFVVKLKKPVSAFLDYIACGYGPKMVSPALIEANEKNGDSAQDWVKTHSAGTGPYMIKEFLPGQRYTLEAVPNYWSTAPTVSTIAISIVPESTTQALQLESGDLDILHGAPLSTVHAFEDKSGFAIRKFPAFQKTQLKVNPNKGLFVDKALRQALRQAINRDKLVPQVFGDIATVSTSMLPAGMLPDGMASDDYEFDMAPLEKLVAALPSNRRGVDLGYVQFNVNDGQLASSIAAQLGRTGLNVKVRPIAPALVFDLRNQPDQAPDLFLETANPDASHPDTWARIFYNTEGFLNYLMGGTAAADAEMDLGLAATDTAAMQAHYAKASDLLFDDAMFITLADVKAVYIVRDDLEGFGSTAAAPLSLNMSAVRRSGP